MLLDEAGWIDHDGDGIRDKDGVKFSFEFLGSVSSGFTDQLSPYCQRGIRKGRNRNDGAASRVHRRDRKCKRPEV